MVEVLCSGPALKGADLVGYDISVKSPYQYACRRFGVIAASIAFRYSRNTTTFLKIAILFDS